MRSSVVSFSMFVAAAVVSGGCSLIVDVGDLARDDAGRSDADVVTDSGEGEAGGDADSDVDAIPDADFAPDEAADGDDGAALDGEDAADPDGDTIDGDGGGDADADGADATVGPPAFVWGELTASGAPADGAGCAARGAGVCLRSDTVDPSALVLSGGAYRLRGIVVQGGAR